MPAWSPEIADEFLRLAFADGRAFDQMQLQKLVYIAHGWCLAASGQPLTGDRPEAWEFGPMYRRLADALASCGCNPVTAFARGPDVESTVPRRWQQEPIVSDLDQLEHHIIARVYRDYGAFSATQLSTLTRRGSTPWKEVFANGAGKFRDIPHALIQAQFLRFASADRETTVLDEAITRIAATVENDTRADSLEEREGADCEARRLGCELLRSELKTAEQKRRLEVLIVERSVRRTDFAIYIATFVLLLQLLFGPAQLQARLVVALVALAGLALRSFSTMTEVVRRR